MILLFTPVKSRIQEGIDRLFYRERYDSRRALLALSQDLNADLDLRPHRRAPARRHRAALGVTSHGRVPARRGGRLLDLPVPRLSPGRRDRAPPRGRRAPRCGSPQGDPVNVESLAASPSPRPGRSTSPTYFPCRVKGEVIAILGVGRKEGLDPLNSEEVDLLQALAGQAATAFMNGRLYRSLREKADELQRLTEYNENILESMDSGILVLDLDGRVARWNRAMESLYGAAAGQTCWAAPWTRSSPSRSSRRSAAAWSSGDREEIAHIYKLHLPTGGRPEPDGQRLGRALPGRLGRAARHDPDPRRRDGARPPRGAAPALREDGLHRPAGRRRGPRGEHAADRASPPTPRCCGSRCKPEDLRYPLLEKIEKQTFRAAKIINNLLNFARSGSAELETLDLNKVLLDVLSLLEHQLEKNRIKVRQEFAEDLPRVRGQREPAPAGLLQPDPERPGRDAQRRLADAATRADDDTVIVEVRDTGDGIRREDIKRIYDPFFTTKGIGPRHRPRPLGLLRHPPGARRRHLRGERPGQGNDLPGGAARRGRGGGGAAVTETASILVVDDEEVMRDVLQTLLVPGRLPGHAGRERRPRGWPWRAGTASTPPSWT